MTLGDIPNMLPIWVKGSTDPTYFFFEIIVGKSRIRHKTTLDFEWKLISRLNSERPNFLIGPIPWEFRSLPSRNSAYSYLYRLKIDWIWRHWNSESFYVGSDSFRHWFKNKMAWVCTTLKIFCWGQYLIFVSEPTRISDMDSNTKSGEPNIPTSQENITQLCKGQCGFFGTADNQGFCSVSTLRISDES